MDALVTVEPKDFGLEEAKAKELTSGLTAILEERTELVKNYKKVITLEISQETIPQFRELRLRIRDNRTKGIEKWHKVNKEFFLTGGRFVDAIKNKEAAENIRMEDALMEGEKHFENLEKERLNKLNEDRIAAVAPYVEYTDGLDLSGMDEDVFEAYLFTKKSKFEAKVAEEKRLELERVEKERLDKVEANRRFELAPYWEFLDGEPNYRGMSDNQFSELLEDCKKAKLAQDKKNAEIEAENDRLRKDREAQAKVRNERNKILQPYLLYIRDYEKTLNLPAKAFAKELKDLQAAKIAQDKHREEEREKAAKAYAKIQVENNRLKRLEQERKDALIKQAAVRKKLAKAPVKEKLNLWVDSFRLPETDVKNAKVDEIKEKFLSFQKWAKNEISNL